MLDTADLAMMQGTLGLIRTTPCQVLRKTSAGDGMGGVSDTWAVISAAGLLCRVAPFKGGYREAAEEGRIEAEDRWTIALPPGQDVTVADRITALGNTYEVTAVGPRTLELERVADCVRLQ